MVTTSSMLGFAMAYRGRGLPIFPCCNPILDRPGWCAQHGNHEQKKTENNQTLADPGKHPLVPWKAYQSRLPTEDEVQTWWTRWPEANIGLVTGALSGLVVLDSDGLDALTAVLSNGGVEGTPTVVTGKPNGFHWYLQHPGFSVRNFAGNRGVQGLDFRGDGGFVVLPPSLHHSGRRYQWQDETELLVPRPCPPWLVDLLREPNGTSSAVVPSLDLTRFLEGVQVGERDDSLYRLACRMRADGVDEQVARLAIRSAAALCSPPFDPRSAEEKVARAYQEFRPNEHLVASSPSSVTTAEPPPPLASLKFLNPAELRAEFESTASGEEAVAGIWWRGRVHWIFGSIGTGKTLLCMAIAYHVAAGAPFSGREVVQGKVLMVEEDSPTSVVLDYEETMEDVYGFSRELPFKVLSQRGYRLTEEESCTRLYEAIEADGLPAVAIFDASERLSPSDKFNSKEFDPFARFLQKLARNGVCVVVIDHTSKPHGEDGGNSGLLIDSLYGGRPKQAISDLMWHIAGSPEKGMTMTNVKMRGVTLATMDVSFDADNGFVVRSIGMAAKTKSEKQVMEWFYKRDLEGWYGLAEVLEGTEISDRGGRRTLSTLVAHGLLIKKGGPKAGVFYQRAPVAFGKK